MKTPSLSAMLFLIWVHSVFAAPGDLDSTFAGTGLTRFGFGFGNDYGRAVATQTDGKLIVAGSAGPGTFSGDLAVARLNADGSLDTTFGSAGKVTTRVGIGTSSASTVRIQADGKILVAGTADNNFTNSDVAVVRYHADGTLDMSFGGTGIVTTGIGGQGLGNDMFVQADGKILVAATLGNGQGTGADPALLRYNADGTLDTTFGIAGTGIVVEPVQTHGNVVGMAVQADGKILLTGGGFTIFLLRFTTNGILDTAFSGDGKVYTTVGAYCFGGGITMQFASPIIFSPDKIIVVGSVELSSQDSDNDFLVLRYNLDGSLDTTFDGDGYVTTSLGTFERATCVRVENARFNPSRIIVGGNAGGQFAVVKYLLDGALDTAFDGDGKVFTSLGATTDGPNQMIFHQGRILLAGSAEENSSVNSDMALVRYNLVNGSLDSTFDTDGIATVDIGNLESEAHAVTIQPDGKILLAGLAYTGDYATFALTRLNADGSPDISFANAGQQVTAFGSSYDSANAIALQPDGKIVLAGRATGAGEDFALARYNVDGSLDVSFDGDGKVLTAVTADWDEPTSVVVQPDGKIVAAGTARMVNDDFAVVRYNPNGSLDTSFGNGGKVITGVGSGEDHGSAVLLQADKKIVVAGYAKIGLAEDFAMVRYNTNGSLDTSFGSLGRVATDFGASIDGAFAGALQPNGKILLAGVSVVGANIDFALARYNTNGTLDNSFGTGGKVTTPIGIAEEYSLAVALQPDGKIVAVGFTKMGTPSKVAVVRYFADGGLDSSYAAGGIAILDWGTAGDETGTGVAIDSLGRVVVAANAAQLFGAARLLGDPFLKIESISNPPGGPVAIEGVGIPGLTHTVMRSATLDVGSFGPAGTVVPDFAGKWRYEEPSIAGGKQFYRLRSP